MVVTKDTTELFGGALDAFINGTTAGYASGDVTLTVEKESFDLTVNDFGTGAPVDRVLTGTSATIVVPFAQLEPDVLAQAVTEATLTASGTLEIGATGGQSLLSNAVQLVLSGTQGTTGHLFTFPAVVVGDSVELAFAAEGQLAYNVTFTALPDPNNLDDTGALMKYETFTI